MDGLFLWSHCSQGEIMDCLFSLLASEHSALASKSYSKAVEATPGALSAASHAVEKPIWKQKLFHRLCAPPLVFFPHLHATGVFFSLRG